MLLVKLGEKNIILVLYAQIASLRSVVFENMLYQKDTRKVQKVTQTF